MRRIRFTFLSLIAAAGCANPPEDINALINSGDSESDSGATDTNTDSDSDTFSPWTGGEGFRIYLSGQGPHDAVLWDFQPADGEKTVIPVPSNWELMGFGAYNYFHEPDTVSDEQAQYGSTFKLPENWREMRVFIVFEGVMTDTSVTINGSSAGDIHQGGFTQFQYEITDLVTFDADNSLGVTVKKRSGDGSVNAAERHADYWLLGGIYRPVYLQAVPRRYLKHTAVDASAGGDFFAKIELDGDSEASERITVLLLDENNSPVGELLNEEIAPGAGIVEIAGHYDISPWSAETPQLYTARFSLLQAGRTVHTVDQTVGFRTVEVRRGDGIYINGRKIRFKGVNRQSFRPEHGRAVGPEDSLEDVRIIKSMNMNAVRAGYTPPETSFLDDCDALGLYVIEGLPGWQSAYDTEIGERVLTEMIRRDGNHPSVIFWANGHEGGWNTELDNRFDALDYQRRTVLHPRESFNGINTNHYESYASVQSILEQGDEIFMPTEFLHGLYDGGGGAGLADYYRLMESSPLSAGGFLSGLCDGGIVRAFADGEVIDTFGNVAADGILGPLREKEGSFNAIRRIWSPITILETSLPEDFNGTLNVENHYDFSNLSTLTLRWQLLQFVQSDSGLAEHVVVVREFSGPDVLPGETGAIDLRLPPRWRDMALLLVSASTPDGTIVDEWSFPIGEAYSLDDWSTQPSDTDATASWEEGEQTLAVSAFGRSYLFAQDSGRLLSVSVDGETFAFSNGPRPVREYYRYPSSLSVYSDGEDIVLDVGCSGELSHFSWRVRPDGRLVLEYEMNVYGDLNFFGINFDFPEDEVTGMSWLGNGPNRVWKNRREGSTYRVWEKAYNDTVTGVDWGYPEFKGYYDAVRWLRLDTSRGPIHFQIDTDEIYVRMYTPLDGPKPMNARMVFPSSGDISFLHGIPAIGTKFLQPKDLGPEGALNHASGLYSGRIQMMFGNR